MKTKFKDLEKRLNEMFHHSKKESIWSIPPKWRGWFYGILSFGGLYVFVRTLCKKWNNTEGKKDLWDLFKIETLNDIGEGFINLVVVIWFGFQATDWIIIRVKAVINKISKTMGWVDPFRQELREKARQGSILEGRREERKRQSRFEESCQSRQVSARRLFVRTDGVDRRTIS